MDNITIWLDAGHYGKYNQSPCNGNYYESDMSWKLHLLLKKYLESYGIKVMLTRDKQADDLGLVDRGKKSRGSNLFISLHSNAYKEGRINEKTDYPIVYAPVNGKGDVLAQMLAECIAKTMGTKQKGKSSKKRGSYGDYYGVIRGATSVGTVGLLIEHSFHTNTRSTNWLLDENNLDKLAQAEAKVIAEYFGAKKTDTVTTNTSADIKAGDEAIFTGNTHYTNANATSGKSCKPGKVTVTKIVEGRHPYHVKAKAGGTSTAHGWVNAEDITPISKTLTAGDKVKVKDGAKTYTGGKLALYVYRRTYNVQSVTGDRVVITMGDTVIAAVNIADLERV